MTNQHPVLALDYGEARIGLAITDPVGIMAHPLETIDVKQTSPLERISSLIEKRQVHQLVVGLPLTMEGNEGTSCIKVRKFIKQLKPFLPATLPIHFMDERFTTITAADKLHAAGKNAKQQRAYIDQAAAVEILEEWLKEQHGASF